MSENLDQQPGVVDLSQAVDLANPVLKAISDFRDTCMQQNAGAVVLIGRGADGNVFAFSKNPGGIVEQAGMIDIGTSLLQSGFQAFLVQKVAQEQGKPSGNPTEAE